MNDHRTTDRADDEVQRFLTSCKRVRRVAQHMRRQNQRLMSGHRTSHGRNTTTEAVKQPSWVKLLISIVDLMNTEIQLGFTFVQVAKTSENAETKARNLENARKAYEVVARFLASKDRTKLLTVGIADRLIILRQQLADLGEKLKTEPN